MVDGYYNWTAELIPPPDAPGTGRTRATEPAEEVYMSKELLAATLQELEGWPDTSLTEDAQGKHRKIVLHYKDQSRLVVMANTPSDQRALPNHIALVRRELRGMGASKTHAQPVKPSKGPDYNPFIPAKQAPFKDLEITVKQANKIDAIFSAIGDLRYGEMLQLAGILSLAAVDTKMRRSYPGDWAKVLHSVADQPEQQP